jgi:hypothetical protein
MVPFAVMGAAAALWVPEPCLEERRGLLVDDPHTT